MVPRTFPQSVCQLFLLEALSAPRWKARTVVRFGSSFPARDRRELCKSRSSPEATGATIALVWQQSSSRYRRKVIAGIKSRGFLIYPPLGS